MGIVRFALAALLLLGLPPTATAFAWDLPGPSVPARAWILVDYHSGAVIGAQRADEPLPPASLTKLMTAYLVFQDLESGRLKLGDKATVSERAWQMAGARMFLRAGARVSVEELLKGMIIRSANDATLTLVEHVSGDEARFVERMNAAAADLHLADSRFLNSTGLHQDGHVSSARDMAALAARLIREFPRYHALFSAKEFTHNGIVQHNRNLLLWRMSEADGLKTGQTRSAGYCLAATARRDNMRMIAVALGAKSERDRTDAGERLLGFGLDRYETRLLYQAHSPAVHLRIWLGDRDTLPIGINEDLYLTLPRGSYGKLKARLDVPQTPTAPVQRGQRIGTLRLDYDGQAIAEHPLIALRAVDDGNLAQRAIDRLRLWLR
jgi:serine-type D-Ala-D-Ala carboxypeptidase (penicillin-binding protein 5/6)